MISTDTVVMNSVSSNQRNDNKTNTSIINSNNNVYNNNNHFHFNNSGLNRCVVKLGNCCNYLVKRTITFVLLSLSLLLTIVSLIQVIKQRSVINKNVLLGVELIIIASTMCMVLLQIVLTKKARDKIALGIGSCLLMVVLCVYVGSKGKELVHVVVNCVLCSVMLALDVVLLLMVKREIKVEIQKQQHIEEIINFTETNGDSMKQQERKCEVGKMEQ